MSLSLSSPSSPCYICGCASMFSFDDFEGKLEYACTKHLGRALVELRSEHRIPGRSDVWFIWQVLTDPKPIAHTTPSPR